jgi:uncharacterized protein YecE (DUF72 family)
LSVVLFQLPPSWNFNCDRLRVFCRFLAEQRIIPGVRVALEVRNASWLDNACFETLRQHNVALAFADWPGTTVSSPVTASFVFVRRHGPAGLYNSKYSESDLECNAAAVRNWRAEGKDVYVYFNNDAAGFAVKNGLRLRQLVEAA